MGEFTIPVAFSVEGETEEEAARSLVSELARSQIVSNQLGIQTGKIVSWWTPNHHEVDGSDDDPYRLEWLPRDETDGHLYLWAVELYPHNESEAEVYLFADLVEAQGFCALVNEQPGSSRAYLTGTGVEESEVDPYRHRLWADAESAIKELGEYYSLEGDDDDDDD